MRTILFIFIVFIAPFSFSQVGIGTTAPESSSVLDISSSDKGVLLPRMTTAQREDIAIPAKGLLVYNTDINAFEYNYGTAIVPVWIPIISSKRVVSSDAGNQLTVGSDGGAYLMRSQHMGKFVINSSGIKTISGLPFKPSMIKFTAYANVDSYSLDADNGVGDNNNGKNNVFGNMTGYATQNGLGIDQQCIFIGASGNSINDISRYASPSHAIGIRYSNQNGNSLGYTTASFTAFTADGFTLNVDSKFDNIVVLYEAFR